MSLEKKGLVKLVEECGELVQVAAKKMALDDFDSWEHWDGVGDLKERLEEEIADVQAAMSVVIAKFDLDQEKIFERIAKKIELFLYWDGGGKETSIPNE
jgi:NTP pyrophosphatase (non-canonical NTP hydrolase)